ncbi:MAG TPA: tetratricopeptide repeat protein [Tepidisphaeraceae bacterium]|jgi:hypothetical protein
MHDSTFLAEQLALVAGYRLDDAPGAHRPALTPAASAALNLARQHVGAGDYAAAAEMAARAVGLAPTSPDARALLGALYLELGDATAAAPQLAATVALAPNWAEASRLCGEAAFRANDMPAARTHLQKALSLRPNWPAAAERLGEVMLKAGDYAAGWPLLDARFALAGRPAPAPRWDGVAPLWGKSVLILPEREIGDLVQFIRYADLLNRRGAVVYVVCPGDLVSILEAVPGVDRAFPIGMAEPNADYRLPLLSLPLAFGTTLGTVPAGVPYMKADEGLLASWTEHFVALAPKARLRVGLIWGDAGDPSPVPVRSVPLAGLEPLWAVPDVAWFALQQGPPQQELSFCKTPLKDVSADLAGPAAIVAAVAALDLLIAVDTPATHVAGALGKPAWAMLAAACDWRWLAVGETTPWYPTVRCFRQDTPGGWEPVGRRVAAALADVMNGA